MTLKEKYNKEVIQKMKKDHNLSSVMQVPHIKKIVVNAGIGAFRENKEAVDVFVEELSAVLGQKPNPRKARLSIAGFKVREGSTVGYSATLRGDRMWAFLEKLINVAIPRIRDFRGLDATAFDNAGNYSLGITEHVIFPEVNQNTVKGIRGLQLTVVSSSSNKDLNKDLLKNLGMPFGENTPVVKGKSGSKKKGK